MRQRHIAVFSTAACLLPLLLCSTTLADGKYYSERAVEKPVAIPSQRAVVRFKDSRETFVIESAAESDSKSLGWVIPLPAEPDRVEVVRPGLFESLALCFGARITHDLWPQAKACGFFFLLLLFSSAALAHGSKVVDVLLMLLLALLLAGLLLPALASTGGRGALEVSGVEVAVARRVGSYDTTVLRADSPEALDKWLASNGFAGLGDNHGGGKDRNEEREIVADYIAKKWCFFAAKLVREEGGAALPHPVLLEFAAEEAVYPMRLTALAGSEPTFDVYVVGEKEATFPGLHAALVDRFRWSGDGDEPRGRLWTSEKVGVRIGHPDLARLLWDGCVVTRFTGSLTPDEMREDVRPGWKGLTPRRDRKYSALGAAYTGLLVFFALGAAGIVVAMVARRRDFGKGGDWRRALVALTVPLGASAIVGLACFIVTPKIDVTTGNWRAHLMADRVRPLIVSERLGEVFPERRPETVVEVSSTIKAEMGREDSIYKWALSPNPHTGGETRIEASPGNFDVREEGGVVRVEYYDRFARPQTCWPRTPRENQ